MNKNSAVNVNSQQSVDQTEFTEFIRAIRNDELSKVEKFSEEFLNMADQGSKPIHKAAFHGSLTVLQHLVDKGANVEDEVDDSFKSRPIHLACSAGCENIVRWLATEVGSVIDVKDAVGRTPLDWAKKMKFDGCVSILTKEENDRKTNEFQIYHLRNYSVVLRKYKVYDFNLVLKKIQENVVAFDRPTVICFDSHNLSCFHSDVVAIQLECDRLRYKEYVIVNKNDTIEAVTEIIKNCRRWTVQIKKDVPPKTPIKSLVKTNDLTFKINFSIEDPKQTWKPLQTTKLELKNFNGPAVFRKLNILIPKASPCNVIRTTFIEFVQFFYPFVIHGLINGKKHYQKEDVVSMIKKFVTMRMQYLNFTLKDNNKLPKQEIVEKSSLWKDENIDVFYCCDHDVSFFPKLERRNQISDFVTHHSILLKCVTDSKKLLVLSCNHENDVCGVKQKVAKYLTTRETVILMDNDGNVIEDNNFSVIDIIYFAIVTRIKEDIWKQENTLGRGAFGDVYEYKDPKIKERCVLKVIDKKDFKMSEILVVARVGLHERIMSFRGFLDTNTKFCILMDRMKMHLGKYAFDNKPLEEKQILKFANQILEGLDYLHEHNIIHRDIKGPNVLLDEKDCVKLTDFGLSKCYGIDSAADKTAIMSVAGSLAYMAPEVVQNEIYGKKADIWSFGVLMIEIMTGHPPPSFPMNNHSYNKIVTYSNKLNNFVQSCFIHQPDKRPSCKDLIENQVFR